MGAGDRNIRVAMVNTFDAENRKNWAGIPYYVLQMMKRMEHISVVSIEVPAMKRNLSSYVRGLYFNKICNKKYYTWADESLQEHNDNFYDRFINEEYDFIITFEFYLVRHIKKSGAKVIYWNDATFQNLHNFYEGYSNLSSFSLTGAHNIQRKSLEQADFIIFSSTWAIDTAIEYYKVDARKLRKILFSSNLSFTPSGSEIEKFIKEKNIEQLNLLFLGVEWNRKGGDDAVKVVDELNRRGISTILFVAGTSIPSQYDGNHHLIALEYLNKSMPAGERKIIDLLTKCHFLILPTRADCTPVVFSEANSFGLPVITTNVGGIASIIHTDRNGAAFAPKDFVNNAVGFIQRNLPGTKQYDDLCTNAYRFYTKEMSWQRVEESLSDLICSSGMSHT